MSLNSHLLLIDIPKALSDFDGDQEAIVQVLQEFDSDIAYRLQSLPLDTNDQERYLGVVHEIANSLVTAWFFTSGNEVRAIENRLRAEFPSDLQSDHDAITMWAEQARDAVKALLLSRERGQDVFAQQRTAQLERLDC